MSEDAHLFPKVKENSPQDLYKVTLAFTYDDSYLTEISHYFQKINIFLPCIILSNSLDGIKGTSKTRILIYPNFSLPTTVHTEYLGEYNLGIFLSLAIVILLSKHIFRLLGPPLRNRVF